mmetsp:Transcript_21314/g.48811  ORF Transcript_21314/g.48811 Transcript_21314/m.48811 type:complete len:113 (+) Transcript_21314:253-591(+)
MLVMAICQCPALATTLCSLQWFGRRSTILALLFLIGFSCTVLALCLEGSPTLRVVFALIGSASTSSAFSAEYIFTGARVLFTPSTHVDLHDSSHRNRQESCTPPPCVRWDYL